MSEIVDLLSIAERRTQRGANFSTVSVGDQEKNAEELQKALDEIKRAVTTTIGDTQVNIAIHQQFVRAIHGSLQAGKENRGVDYFINKIYPSIADINTNIIINVSGSSIEEYIAAAEKINELDKIPAIELNISCPNVKQGGMGFGTSCVSAAEVVKEVR